MAKVLACPNGCHSGTNAARIRCGQCGAELIYLNLDAIPAAETGSEASEATAEKDPAAEEGPRQSRVPAGLIAAAVVILALAGFVSLWNWWAPAGSPRAASSTGRADATGAIVRPAVLAGAASTAASELLRPNDLGQVLDRYRDALADRPSDPVLLDNVGQILVASGRPADAIPYLKRAVDAEPWSVTARFDLAGAYARSGRPKEAEELYAELAQSGSTDPRVYHNLGLALRQLNRNSDAVQAFGQATRLAPGEAPAWLGLGLSLETEGRLEEAAEALDRYLALQSTGAEADSVRARRARLRVGSAPTPSQAAPDDATPRRGP